MLERLSQALTSHRGLFALLLGVPFVVAYFVVRALPTEPCEVLHYGDYINSEGEILFCGEEETAFFDMTKVRFPVHVSLSPSSDLAAGEEGTFALELRDFSGAPLSYEDLVVNHTERLHLMAVDPSLEDYHHVHPKPTGAPGSYQFSLTPKRSGTYSVYLDFIPLKSSKRVLAKAQFEVPGAAEQPAFAPAATAAVDQLAFEMKGLEQPLREGETTNLKLQVADEVTEPVRFEPVMGAYAHVVAFDENGKGFAHLHPLNPFLDGQDPTAPDLEFTFNTDEPGYYRLWAQVKIDGQERFIPFDLEVR